MPRPKPLEVLKRRDIRMTDRQWLILRELGGAKWLRETLEKKASMPAKYYATLRSK
jgi:hypothetical protein